MKELLKVVEIFPQRSFETQNHETVVSVPMILEQGRDQFFAEAYGKEALSLPQNLGGGEMVWADLSFSVRSWENKESQRVYSQSVQVSNVRRI